MGLREVCFGVTVRTGTSYSCVTLLWSDRLCPLATYMTVKLHMYFPIVQRLRMCETIPPPTYTFTTLCLT